MGSPIEASSVKTCNKMVAMSLPHRQIKSSVSYLELDILFDTVSTSNHNVQVVSKVSVLLLKNQSPPSIKYKENPKEILCAAVSQKVLANTRRIILVRTTKNTIPGGTNALTMTTLLRQSNERERRGKRSADVCCFTKMRLHGA